MEVTKTTFLEGESPTYESPLSHDIKSHPLAINTNIFKQTNVIKCK